MAVIPELPSEPPQLVARISSEIGLREELQHRLGALLHGLPHAARFLDGEDGGLTLRVAGDRHPLPLHHDDGLVDLAAQADQEVGGDVGVLGVARQDALERQVVLAEELGPAAGLVGDRQHAVHVRKVLPHVAELLADELADAGGAVDRRDHRHIVARADPAIPPPVALEGAHLGGRIVVHGPDVGADLVLALELPDRQVVSVDVIALGDGAGGEPDHLAVAPDGDAHGNMPAGNFMPRPDVLTGLDDSPSVLEERAGTDLGLGDRDVVLGAEDDRLVSERAGHHHFSLGLQIRASAFFPSDLAIADFIAYP